MKPDKYFEEAGRLSERELYRSGLRAIKYRQEPQEEPAAYARNRQPLGNGVSKDLPIFLTLSLIFAPLFGIGTYLFIELYAPDFEQVILKVIGSKPGAYALLSITCWLGILLGRMVYNTTVSGRNSTIR